VDSKLSMNFVLATRVAAGGWVRLYFPADYMTVSANAKNCAEAQGLLTLTSCTVDTGGNYIEFVTQDAIELTGATSTDSENF
jgi:hypothetical protein